MSICARGADGWGRCGTRFAAHGVTAHARACDVATQRRFAGYIESAAAALGGIDILVCNASGFGSTNNEAGWARSLGVDLMGTVRAIEAAEPYLERSGAGAVVNISSTAAFHSSVRTTPYSVAKSALVQYTRNRASAFATKSIRVNCVAPGSIEFPGGSREKRKSDNPNLYNTILRGIPFGRLGHPEEVARVVLFLASPLANWLTGQTIAVDGGQLL